MAVKDELRQMRNLNKRGVTNALVEKYRALFTKLPPLEEKVMEECYLRGRSYMVAAVKFSYSERQIIRIVKKGIRMLEEMKVDS